MYSLVKDTYTILDFFKKNILVVCSIRLITALIPYLGKVSKKQIGGEARQNWRSVDYKRTEPTSGPPLVERVQRIQYDPHTV